MVCGKVLLQNAPRTLRGPKNQSFGAKTLEGPKKQKKKKKQSSGALGSLAAQDSKTLFFVFLGPSSVLAPKFWFFWTFHGVGKVLLQNAPKILRGPKNQSFGAKALEGPKKQKKQSSGALGSLAAQDSKTLFFVFLGPSSVLAPKFWFFWTFHGVGKVLLQNAPKILRGPKNQSFGAKALEGPKNTKKNKVLEHWVVWQLKTPKLCFLFFWDPPAFWHQSFGFFGPSMVLARFCSKMLPKF